MQPSDDIAQKVAKALAGSRWKPADPTLLHLLLHRNEAASRGIVRIGMWAAVISYIFYGLFDWFLFPDIATRLVAVRFALGLTFIGLIEICVRRHCSLMTLHITAASAIVVGGTGWLAVALATEHQQTLSLFMVFGTVFVLGVNLFFIFRLIISAVSSIIITIVYIYSYLNVLEIDFLERLILSTYFFNSLALSLYLSWRLILGRYRAFLHSLRAQFQEQAAIEKGQKLNEMANTDPLTGLKNRRAIAQDFTDMCKDWATQEDKIGVVVVDVDFFKRFNDRLGHQAGDDCLIQLAQAFAQTAATHGGIAARYGGEEFVFLCRVTGMDQLAELAQNYCKAVEQLQIVHPDRGDGRPVVTISAGASMTRPDNRLDFRTLLQEADRALYKSKFLGRAIATVFDPDTIQEDRSSVNLADLLSTAIDEQRVSVVYQPIYEVGTDRLIGHETLMRMRNREGDMVSPIVFIPAAEASGAINELGLWAIERACCDLSRGDLGAVVAVNISALQLKAWNFSNLVGDILARYRIGAQKLALEITEGIDIVPDATALRNIEQLRGLGVQVWLDDFGTGFASLEWLKRFDFDVVKIDRTFLHDCHTPQGLRMFHDIVRLLRNQGHTVLVEGVETEEQKALLPRLGVNLMQGFLLGYPTSLAVKGEKMPTLQVTS